MTKLNSSITKLNQSIEKALQWSLGHQEAEGYWIGDIDTNCCMEAQWIMAMHFMGRTDDPKFPEIVRAILTEQRPDGSWEIYYQASTGDINTTVECYAALRIAGLDPHSDVMTRARNWILDHGGLKHIRVFTKYWLALLGEWPWKNTPNLPPEIIFLPPWMPFNIYSFSSWARATIVPLTLLCSKRPSRPLPPEKRLDELFPDGRDHFDFGLPRKSFGLCWEGLFLSLDRFLNWYCTCPLQPFRETARKFCIDWVIRHQDEDGVWGGIQPPLIYSLMALFDEGYLMGHPVLKRGLRAFGEHWSRKKDGGLYINASESIIWDTFLTMLAFLDCGVNAVKSDSFQQAMKWVLNKFVEAPGDWQVYVKGVKPGGWSFERANTWYPDVDDTAVAVIVFARILDSFRGHGEMRRKLNRAIDWIMAMQSANGGWAAFDRDNNSLMVTRIPFCDFGEALDPPSVDVTGHVLEALGLLGKTKEDPAVRKAVRYIKSEQEKDGSWFGRWGVNYIYGTAAVLPGLEAIGEDMSANYIQRAVRWICGHQNPDGGWGESCGSYMDDSLRGRGHSTASQTGWAIMALVAAKNRSFDQNVIRGIEYLLNTQREDGTWDEPWYTGTGFPGYGWGDRADLKEVADKLEQGTELSRGFMLNYNLYRHYFPMMAMGRARSYLADREK